MSLYVPEQTAPIVPHAMIRIERKLPYPGEVLVREGMRVEPEDTVARAYIPASPQVINVAQALAIPPSAMEDVMLYEVGATVSKGDDLAQGNFMSGGRRCTSPVSGVIGTIDTETGYVTITPDPEEWTMAANIRGVIMEVRPYEGVVIETYAAQVYGAFGLGKERSGVLQLFVTDPDEVVTHEHQIDARSAYTILIAGAGITAAALQKACQAQVRGVIVGGIDERDLRTFLRWSSHNNWQTGVHSWKLPDREQHDPGLTLMVTEGFGIRPMSQPIFELLSARDRQEALIEGTTQLRAPLRRPRLVISLARSTEGQIEPTPSQLRPNALVRLLDRQHLGQVAQVRSIPAYPVRLETGSRVSAVEVVQEDGTSFFVPRTAIEVIN
jgi:hypothetical protein